MPTPLEDFISNRLPRITRKENLVNWFENVSKRNAEIIRPESRTDVKFTVQYAEKNNKKISVFGSKWSYTDCAIDIGNDIHLDTSKLNRLLAFTNLRHLGLREYERSVYSSVGSGRTDAKHLNYVQAGIKLHELNCELDAKGFALHTLGGSSGQSLAGAINTATHGADFKMGPLAAAVRAIHLISYGGIEYWIEPSQTMQITKQEKWEDPKLNILYDDDLFESTLVSFGCSGIVYAYVLETVPAFNLRSVSIQEPWTQTKTNVTTIANTPDLVPFDFFEAIITHDDKCRVTRRLRATNNAIRDYKDRNNTMVDQTDPQSQIDRLNRCWAFNILGIPVGRNAIDRQVRSTIFSTRPSGNHQHKSWIIHTFQPDCPTPPKEHNPAEKKILSQEYIVSAKYAVQIIDDIREILRTRRKEKDAIIVTINLRITQGSTGYLAPQIGTTAHLEIYLIDGANGNVAFVQDLKTLIKNFNAIDRGDNARHVKIRPHWGQIHDPTIFDFNSLYEFLPKWRQNIDRLKAGSTKDTFDTTFARVRGLL